MTKCIVCGQEAPESMPDGTVAYDFKCAKETNIMPVVSSANCLYLMKHGIRPHSVEAICYDSSGPLSSRNANTWEYHVPITDIQEELNLTWRYATNECWGRC